VLTALYGFYARVGLQGELLNIMNHALYKSSLFLLVGWLEKAAGTRDLRGAGARAVGAGGRRWPPRSSGSAPSRWPASPSCSAS
jgi:hypothetical protein